MTVNSVRARRRAGAASQTGLTVRLREIRPADHRVLAGFDRDAARGHDLRLGGYRHWAAHRGRAADPGDDFHFAIEARHSRAVVGSMWIQADPATRRFSYGIGIGPQHRRCGYAADAVTVLLTVMFEQRGYRECVVSVNGANFASLALHGELGFREEGRPRDTELRHGEVRYPVLMGLTAARFAAHQRAGRAPLRPERGRHWRTPRRGRHWASRTAS
ncbi:GNAT family N-acetyltransferase [Amycolatopsis carbonis]|uniref:GNAT family N-acetyltransferase n=1 Tax=Amycolatopsis carbonis TaxID=715471 RepID=UPI003DA6DDF4